MSLVIHDYDHDQVLLSALFHYSETLELTEACMAVAGIEQTSLLRTRAYQLPVFCCRNPELLSRSRTMTRH